MPLVQPMVAAFGLLGERVGELTIKLWPDTEDTQATSSPFFFVLRPSTR
jgi:hypothetical protein